MGQRHDDVCEEWARLCSMALTPARISSEPEIFYGRGLNAAQRSDSEVLGDEARGDVGAHGFWKQGRTTIIDVQVCDTELTPRVTGIANRRRYLRRLHEERK